jgi:hypothetical protein
MSFTPSAYGGVVSLCVDIHYRKLYQILKYCHAYGGTRDDNDGFISTSITTSLNYTQL